MKRPKRYIWVPCLLLVYAGVMAYIGRGAIYNPEGRLRYFLTVAAELVLIGAVSFTMRWRDRMKERREAEDRERGY